MTADISAQVAAQVGEWIAERDRFRDECSRLADQVERLKADRRALDIAVTGLRELETTWANDAAEISDPRDQDIAEVVREAREAVSALLNRIGGTR